MRQLSLLALVLAATVSCGPPPPPEPVCFGAGTGAAPGAPPSSCKSEGEWREQALQQCVNGKLTAFEVRQPCGNDRFAGMSVTCCEPAGGAPRVDPAPPRR